MKTVLVNVPIHPVAMEMLSDSAKVITPNGIPADQVLGMLPEVHGIILGAGLNIGPEEMDLAERLEVIGRHGAGMDTVDLAAATERRLPVTYTPYGPTESTAEHALLLILATARQLPQLDRAVRTGDFALRSRPSAMGHEVQGKTLGHVIHRFFSGSPHDLVLRLLEDEQLSLADLESLLRQASANPAPLKPRRRKRSR